MALVERYVLIEYDVPGPRVVHERWVLGHVAEEEYIVVTPDEDIFTEQLSITNQDLRSIRVRAGPGVLPADIPPGVVYGLPNWGAADLARLRNDAATELAAELARRRGGAGVVAPAAAVAAPAVVAPVVWNESEDSTPPGVENISGAGAIWVAAEATESVRYGEPVVGVVAPVVQGAKTVHVMPDGSSLFCMCIAASDVESFNGRTAACDARILKIRLTSLGTPERTMSEIVAESKEFKVSWKLVGPRTAKWCLNYLVIEGLGFEAHHERFRQLCKLDVTNWGVMEHFQLSMILRQLLQVDMINGCNTLGVELMFRRLQTIEYAHSEKAREAESKAMGGKLSLEEQFTFGSMVRQAATLMIAPSLLDHVKQEVERDVQLQKNIRKAREERDMARKNKGKKSEEGL